MKVREVLGRSYQRIRQAASQFYTPRELRALILFLLTGIGVLAYRYGETLFVTTFPSTESSAAILQRRETDRLFHALTAQANARDSLFFSLPEDSLLPEAHRSAQHHSKEEGLLPHSVSLNHGTKEDLVRLPGVGPATAEHILEYRSERGRFRTLEELKNIRGFGETRFERMKKYLKLD